MQSIWEAGLPSRPLAKTQAHRQPAVLDRRDAGHRRGSPAEGFGFFVHAPDFPGLVVGFQGPGSRGKRLGRQCLVTACRRGCGPANSGQRQAAHHATANRLPRSMTGFSLSNTACDIAILADKVQLQTAPAPVPMRIKGSRLYLRTGRPVPESIARQRRYLLVLARRRG